MGFLLAAGVSAGAGLIGSSMAASAQTSAANQANATQMAMYNQSQADLKPYMTAGENSLNQLQSQMSSLTANFNPTMAQLEQTPGYQFTLDQGLKSTQNSYAAQGLGSSGAAMKGAADYATGLASNTYQQQFNNYWTQNQNKYNMLNSQAQLGESAAAGAAVNSQTTWQNVAQTQSSLGNALGSSYISGANSVGNAASQYGMYSYMNSLRNGGVMDTSSANTAAYANAGNMFG